MPPRTRKPVVPVVVPEGEQRPADGAWQVDESGQPFTTSGGRKIPLIEGNEGFWHPVVHRRTRTVMQRYPSNGQPDLNPVRHYAKVWGISRKQAERRLAQLMADAQQE